MLEPHLAGRAMGSALEAGCGTGYLTQLLQRERGWPIVPLDFSGDGLHYARELGVRNPVQGDIRCLPFGDGAFDLVLSLDVLAHLPRGDEHRGGARTGAGSAARRAGGGAHVGAGHPAQPARRIRLRTATLHAAPPDGTFRRRGHTDSALQLPQSLLMPVALVKFRVWEPLLRKAPESGVQPVAPWLDRLLFAPLAVEAACLGAGRNLPAGQSLLLIGEKMS